MKFCYISLEEENIDTQKVYLGVFRMVYNSNHRVIVIEGVYNLKKILIWEFFYDSVKRSCLA